jgi:hypothetical protein
MQTTPHRKENFNECSVGDPEDSNLNAKNGWDPGFSCALSPSFSASVVLYVSANVVAAVRD